MTISKDEVFQYMPPEIKAPEFFCWIGDVFGLVSYSINDPKKVSFHCYGLIDDIVWDTETEIKWKRINVYFVNLSTFPPVKSVLNMQIHHIILGKYQNASRDQEFQIVPINKAISILKQVEEQKKEESEEIDQSNSKILTFRKKN